MHRHSVRFGARLGLTALSLLGTLSFAGSTRAERELPPHLARLEAARPEAAAPARALVPSPYDALWVGYPLPDVYSSISSSTPAIRAMLAWGGGIVVAGSGRYFGTTTARYVALWDGIGWQALGDGLPSSVNSLAAYGGLLVAGTGAGGIGTVRPAVFTWDGTDWTTIGSANGGVFAMAVVGSDLFVGGSFTSMNGVAATAVARWDGTNWYAVGPGISSGSTVRALVAHDTALVAGGFFAGDFQTVLQFNGSSWVQLGAGLSGTVYGLASDDATLYAGGGSLSSGGSPLSTDVAAWNGSTWSGLPGADAYSQAVTLYGGFPMATVLDGGVSRPHLWDGAAWQGFNQANVNPFGYVLEGATLYAGGSPSTTTDPAPTNLGGFASFDGAAWTALGQAWAPGMKGLTGGAWCALEHAGSLYVGGPFTHFGADDHFQLSRRVARWDGTGWSAMNSTFTPYNMTVWNDSLVANMSAYLVQVWNGSTWRGLQLAQGVAPFGGDVWEVTTHQGRVYAFGPPDAEGTVVNGVASWGGSGWEPVGTGVDPYYRAYCGTTWGTNLVVAGEFTSAGGSPARHIAYWDGSAYHPMGTGVNGRIWSVIEFDGDLVAGGPSFTEAGGESVHTVARFDGAAWHAMGTRARGINRLRAHNGRLYAAGGFLDDLGQTVQGAALWNGSEWSLLGSGARVFGTAYDVGFLGDDLYLLGDFNEVNGQPARGFAKLPNVSTLDAAPDVRGTRLLLAPSPNPSRGSVRFSVTLPAAGRARLVIHDVSGREVARLLNGTREAGTFSLAWEGRVAPGLYFATLEAAGERTTTRVARLR